MAGCSTMAIPTAVVRPCTRENVPASIPQASTARLMASPTSCDVPGCAGCALTTTGQPAASADAISPPATEKASGKLLAPKTPTGPNGRSICRRSGRGSGCRSGRAVSIRASTQEPSRRYSANKRSCPVVRPRSPVSRGKGSPDSACAAVQEFVSNGLDLGGYLFQKTGFFGPRLFSVVNKSRSGLLQASATSSVVAS